MLIPKFNLRFFLLLTLGLVTFTNGALASQPTIQEGPAKEGQKSSQGPITKVGEYRLYGGKLIIKVKKEGEGKVRWWVTRNFQDERKSKHENSVNDPLIREGSPWFIVPASPDAVWIYDGEKHMLLLEYGFREGVPSGSETFTTLPSGWETLVKKQQPTQEVLKRLPPELRPQGSAKK